MRNDTLRANMIARRKALAITQERLAAMIGVSPNTYQRWENRPETLSLDKLDRIAKALGTTRQALQGGGFTRIEALEEPQAGLDTLESYRDSLRRLNTELRSLRENNQCLILLAEKLQTENDSLAAENADLKALLAAKKK